MSSWRKSLQDYSERARRAVADVVRALRDTGCKAEVAAVDAARQLNISERRVRVFLFRDGEPVVLRDEWNLIRMRSAFSLRRVAHALRRKADEYDRKAAALENEQPDLWGWLCDGERRGGSSERRAA